MPRLTTLVLGFITAILCGSLFASTESQLATQSLSRMPLAFTKNMGQWDDSVLFRATSGGATMWFTKEGVTYQFTRHVDSGNLDDRRGTLHVPAGTRSVPLQEGLDSRLRGNGKEGGNDMEPDSVEQLVLTAKFVGANPNPEIIAEGQMEYKCNYFLGNDPTKWHTDVPNYEAITLKDIYPGIDLKYSGGGNGQAGYEFIAAPGADIAQIKVAYEGAEETSLDDEGNLVVRTKWGDMIAAIGSGVSGTGLVSPRFALNSEHTLGFAADGQSLAQANSGTLELSYSTYLGGEDSDFGYGIAADGNGNAFVTGWAMSSYFPTTPGAYDPTYNDDYDAFVAKFSSTGALIYSTYLGGGSVDEGFGITVDGSGNAYVTGETYSSDFPTQNAFQGNRGWGWDVFVIKLSSSGNSLIYGTYLSGGGNEAGFGIAVDGGGSAYVTGWTDFSNFPTLNPYQGTFQGGVRDAFVTRLSSSGNTLIYSTYLGGGDNDWGYSIAVDGSGNAYVTGVTNSSNFPTQDPFQSTLNGSSDVFVTKLSSTGNSLIYSTYLGGGSDDEGQGIAVDGSGNAYVTGYTSSTDFPTLNPYQTDQSGTDAFVTKLSSSGNTLIYSTYLGGGNDDEGFGIAVDGSGNAYVTGDTYSFDFPTLNPYQGTFQGYCDVFVTKLSSSGNSLIYCTYLGGASQDNGYGIAVNGSGYAYVTGYTGSSDFPTLNPYQTSQEGDAFVTKLNWTPDYPCGDVNTDEQIDLLDAVFLINYIFVGGPAPQPLSLADVDCSGRINIADCVCLINYIFSNGPAPCAGC